ncbi:MAG: response regulator transcription factor [Verrucomicrobiota bacterium]
MNPISILLCEDHTMLRDGLRSLLEDEEDIKIIGEAANGRLAVKLCQTLKPDVVVMDIRMPLLNGLEATRQILKDAPNTKVLILSASSDPAHLEELVKLKISGYLLKQTAASSLPSAIRAASKGETVFNPTVARYMQRLAEDSQLETNRRRTTTQLTTRETEVLQLVAEGKANKEMAAELNICMKTVEKHRQNLMDKLNIHETAGLTRYAIDRGLVESEVRVAG